MKIRDIVKYRKEIEMLKPERHVLIIYNDGNSEIHECGDGTIIEVPDDFSFENVFIISFQGPPERCDISCSQPLFSGPLDQENVGVLGLQSFDKICRTIRRVIVNDHDMYPGQMFPDGGDHPRDILLFVVGRYDNQYLFQSIKNLWQRN